MFLAPRDSRLFSETSIRGSRSENLTFQDYSTSSSRLTMARGAGHACRYDRPSAGRFSVSDRILDRNFSDVVSPCRKARARAQMIVSRRNFSQKRLSAAGGDHSLLSLRRRGSLIIAKSETLTGRQ
jgi:hypothetical protein